MKRTWLLVPLVPVAAFAVLFLVPVDFWNPGEPGLASGRIDVAAAPRKPPRQSRLGDAVAAAKYSWHEGGKLHVDLVSDTLRVTIILSRGIAGTVKGAAVLRSKRAGDSPPERRALTGRVELVTEDWGASRLPAGTFELRVAEQRFTGSFVPPPS